MAHYGKSKGGAASARETAALVGRGNCRQHVEQRLRLSELGVNDEGRSSILCALNSRSTASKLPFGCSGREKDARRQILVNVSTDFPPHLPLVPSSRKIQSLRVYAR